MKKRYAYWLANIKGIGRVKIKRLLDFFQTPENIYRSSKVDLKESEVLTQRDVEEIEFSKKMWNLEREYEKLQQCGVEFTTVGEKNYPPKLIHIPDPPYGLYYIGNLPKEDEKILAIIGARNCSEYGRYMAREFAIAFAREGIATVSGLAKGIDGIGQKATLSRNVSSYAVLGCGVDICYPEQNRDIYEALKKGGGIMSEYAIGTKPHPSLFPPRNRIISGLSDGVLVIEAKEKSGTSITVDMALEQGKDVYALPGRVTDSLSAGCNQLIKQGAIPAWSPQAVLEEFLQTKNFQKESNQEKERSSNWKFASKEERVIYHILDITPKSPDQILQELKWTDGSFGVSELMNTLLSLTLRGAAVQVGQNHYQKQM